MTNLKVSKRMPSPAAEATVSPRNRSNIDRRQCPAIFFISK
jgi:hypothetical protein